MIRVCLINDKAPPAKVLSAELRQYFELCSDPGLGLIPPINSLEDYSRWSSALVRGHSDCLPPDILVFDYDLSKAQDNEPVAEKMSVELRKAMRFIQTRQELSQTRTAESEAKVTDSDFDGLLIAMHLSAISHAHPQGVVPITSVYGVSTIRMLNQIENVLRIVQGVDFSSKGTLNKTWEAILRVGVARLRDSLAQGFITGSAYISVAELRNLAQNIPVAALSVRSHLTKLRQLPMAALFFDTPQEALFDRREIGKEGVASSWARSMLEKRGLGWDAEELADQIWNAYAGSNSLVSLRRALQAAKSSGADLMTQEFQTLRDAFGVTRNNLDKCPEKDAVLADIEMGTYSAADRRWAVLLLIGKLLREDFKSRKKAEELQNSPNSGFAIAPRWPALKELDVLLCLFGMTSSLKHPFAWSGADNLDTWSKKLKRIGKLPRGGNAGSEGVSIKHVLEGEPFAPDQKSPLLGMRMHERQVLRNYFETDSELEGTGWQQDPAIRKVLYGS